MVSVLALENWMVGDTKFEPVIIKPKPPFMPVFQAAVLREGSAIQLYKSTYPLSRADINGVSWWRRGRVELPVQKKVASTSTSVVCTLMSPAQPLQAEFKRAI
jgi:hypothetical protein